jgi:acetylornithine deacetylase/succinyl-diaminopimelate desuccinylase-like protein
MVNVIPTSAELYLDGRLLPGFTPDDLFRELRAMVGGDLELEVVRHDPGPVGPDMSAFDTLVDILRGADPGAAVAPLLLPAVTDARFFGRLGIQTYGFLPVPLPASFDFLRTIHGADERVPADALELGAGCVYELLRRFL